jgi:hypothetical protein
MPFRRLRSYLSRRNSAETSIEILRKLTNTQDNTTLETITTITKTIKITDKLTKQVQIDCVVLLYDLLKLHCLKKGRMDRDKCQKWAEEQSIYIAEHAHEMKNKWHSPMAVPETMNIIRGGRSAEEMMREAKRQDCCYALWHPMTKHFYIGETMDIARRYGDHLYDARHKGDESTKAKMMRDRGFNKWIITPIRLLGRVTPSTRRSHEKQMITRFQPTMNSGKGRKCNKETFRSSTLSWRKSKKNCSQRKWKSTRRKNETEQEAHVRQTRRTDRITRQTQLHAITEWTPTRFKTQPIPKLDGFLDEAQEMDQRNNTHIIVIQGKGLTEKTNTAKMKREYGELRFVEYKKANKTPTHKRKQMTWPEVMEKANTNTDINQTEIIYKLVNTQSRTDRIKTIEKWRSLANHRYALQSKLRKMNIEDTLTIIAEVHDEIKDPATKQRILTHITQSLKKKIGIRSAMSFTYKYKYTDEINIASVKEFMNEIALKAGIMKPLTEYIRKKTTILPTNRRTIQQMLINNKKIQETWTNTHPPACTCGTKNGKHLQMEMKDMKGLVGEIGKMNTKTVPTPSKKETKQAIVEILNSFIGTLAAIKGKVKETNNKTRKKGARWLNRVKTQVSIFDEKGNINWTADKERMRSLSKSYANCYDAYAQKYQLKGHVESLHDELTNLWDRHKTTRKEDRLTTPYELNSIFRKHLHTQIERRATPLNNDKRMNAYNSKYKEDELFGATYIKDGIHRTMEGMMTAPHTDTGKENAIRDTVKWAEGGANTMLIITTEGSLTTTRYMKMLQHPYIKIIKKWEKNTFKFLDHRTGREETVRGQETCLAYVTKQQAWRLPTTMSKEIDELSERKFGSTPMTFKRGEKTKHQDQDTWRAVAKEIRKMNTSIQKQYRHTKKRKYEKQRKTKRTHTGEKTGAAYIQNMEMQIRNTLQTMGIKLDNNMKTLVEGMMKEQTHTEQQIYTRSRQKGTLEDILKVKKQTEHLVITPMDKNTTMLFIECPVMYHKRMANNIFDNDKFQKTDKKEKALLAQMENEYKHNGLERFGKWVKAGKVPIAFVHPKFKAPYKKERMIASYRKSPMRRSFKKAGKILTWMLRRIPEKYKHFTLHSLSNLKERVARASKEIERKTTRERTMAMQSDICCMYTHLSRAGIKKAVKWMFKVMGEKKQYRETSGGKNRTPRKAYKNIISIIDGTNIIDWGKSTNYQTGSDTVTSFRFQDLERIIDFDLKYTYARVGKMIYKQKAGVPIGGLLSGFYANVYCAYCEQAFLEQMKDKKKHFRIAGIRQMDDLTVWFTYKGKKGKQEADKAKHALLNTVYGDGLEVEEEGIEIQGNTFTHTFSGTTIEGHQSGPQKRLIMRAFNKNRESLEKTGTQKFRRFPPNESFVSSTYKISTAIGNFTRTARQHTDRSDIQESLRWDIVELKSINYPRNIISSALWKVKKEVLSAEEKREIGRWI